MRIPGRGRQWQLLAVLLVVLLPGSAQPHTRGKSLAPGDAAGAQHPAGHHGPVTAVEQVTAAALHQATAPANPADLAVRFEGLLGQHSVLAADLMRSRIRGDDDFVQSANAALGKNTEAMTGLMSQLFGAATANRFSPMWEEHIEALFAYASALADRDDAARKHAREELVEYEEDLAAFFAGASHGRLSPAAARKAVIQHVGHLTMQADAYAAGNYPTADRIYREGYQHTYDMGLTLADALLPASQRAALRAPIWRLRSQLGKLLAEHAVLVEDVTRAAVTNSADFAASGQTINGNTRDLTAAMDVLFGAAAAQKFQSLWASHVENLVAYSGATAAGDQGRQQQARTGLGTFEREMTAFLATATGNRMTSDRLAAALLDHDGMLLRHADAYASKDYATAHDIAYDLYDQMLQLARSLADAFGATVAARLPRGGPHTGYGGQAAVVERR